MGENTNSNELVNTEGPSNKIACTKANFDFVHEYNKANKTTISDSHARSNGCKVLCTYSL